MIKKGEITKNKQINNMTVNYLFETDKESIKTYYKMKCKNNLFFTEEEKVNFISTVNEQLKNFLEQKEFDCILIPETKNECFKEIVKNLNYQTVMIRKRSKEEILTNLESQKMMKAERKKLVDNIMQMEDVKIGLVAANQRERVANVLFEDIESIKDKKVLFLDDSVFTGSTFKAIVNKFKVIDTVVLFSNKD